MASGAAYLLKVSFLNLLPKHISREQYNYYVAELAFYWSLMFSQFIDIRRKVSQQELLCCISIALFNPSHILNQNCFS